MKILISDFDKTFYTENYDNNIKLINEFVNSGNKFVIATGRPLYFLEPSIEWKNINYYNLITYFNNIQSIEYKNDNF